MKEVSYKPSIMDLDIILTAEDSPCALVRIKLYRFLLREPITMGIIFAFDSKCLGDYVDLHPNIQVADIQLIQIHPIEGDVLSRKELRLKLSHGENIMLNERDEIFALKLFKGPIRKTQGMFTPEDIWGIPNEGFLSLILMTNRFASVIENYSRGQNQKQILMRFWLDYRIATANPRNDFSSPLPHLIRGEFTSFMVTQFDDEKVKFDLISDEKDTNHT